MKEKFKRFLTSLFSREIRNLVKSANKNLIRSSAISVMLLMFAMISKITIDSNLFWAICFIPWAVTLTCAIINDFIEISQFSALHYLELISLYLANYLILKKFILMNMDHLLSNRAVLFIVAFIIAGIAFNLTSRLGQKIMKDKGYEVI